MICLKCIFKALPSDLRSQGSIWLQTPRWRVSQGSLLPTSCSLAMGAAFLGQGVSVTKPALALLPGLLSIPRADLWQPRWKGDKGKQPRVVEKKGDIE